VALEVDRGLFELLQRSELPESVELRHADVLRTDLGSIVRELGPPVVLLGNLPYSLSGRLLGALLGPKNPFRRMALMLQAEVADRILAEPGSRSYGVLSVWTSLWATARRGMELGPEAFEPRPRVRSTLVVFEPVPGPRVEDVPLLRQVVRRSFQHRRKTLRAGLRRAYPSIEAALERAGVDASLRPEALSAQDFVSVANAMAEVSAP
jgi:16S rRNA (adenine1518-N6/adenine1519-N6)-dimethyltransferase